MPARADRRRRQAIVLESTRDITEGKVRASRQRLLLQELTHRMKNALAVIQSMVTQTWRNSPRRTNCGALSVDKGEVDLAWEIVSGNGRPVLRVTKSSGVVLRSSNRR
jgi:hypothetical protein